MRRTRRLVLFAVVFENQAILVNSSNEIEIVDYDTFFVPALSGTVCPELGHRNYQHPKRCAHDFHALLDNFSAWVIYISLICVSEDPRLWELLSGGDDCLLFRQKDFAEPLNSQAFYVLENHANETIRLYATFLRGLLELDLIQVPFLGAQVVNVECLPSVSLPAVPLAGAAKLGSGLSLDKINTANSRGAAIKGPFIAISLFFLCLVMVPIIAALTAMSIRDENLLLFVPFGLMLFLVNPASTNSKHSRRKCHRSNFSRLCLSDSASFLTLPLPTSSYTLRARNVHKRLNSPLCTAQGHKLES